VQSCAAAAGKRLEKLLEPENLPSTENHYLFDTINKIRNKRMADKIKALPNQGGAGCVNKDTIIAMLQSNIGNDSNESQEVQDMIDFLAAYWKLAMKRYVDEVCMVVTDSFTAPGRIDEIETKLAEAVLSTDDQSLERLFRMERHIERRRLELEDTRTKMVAARKRIADFSPPTERKKNGRRKLKPRIPNRAVHAIARGGVPQRSAARGQRSESKSGFQFVVGRQIQASAPATLCVLAYSLGVFPSPFMMILRAPARRRSSQAIT